ncbi:hypothetical protein Y032_0079g1250 [Ancylostoma ceylanicum]|uniref:Uncharacterized protein n=1 Tax=Ancylostoma ceylanicum TaxID=53326 RepID=A0A016TS83_9BILA|nr:hypothetical protein Y032_0079g1250 [Ancylostoma ceylanicum]
MIVVLLLQNRTVKGYDVQCIRNDESAQAAHVTSELLVDQSGRPADAGLPDFFLCSLRSHDFSSHPS